jgi:hypothetical protein
MEKNLIKNLIEKLEKIGLGDKLKIVVLDDLTSFHIIGYDHVDIGYIEGESFLHIRNQYEYTYNEEGDEVYYSADMSLEDCFNEIVGGYISWIS